MGANAQSAATPSTTSAEISQPSPLMAADLAGRMTPGRETPTSVEDMTEEKKDASHNPTAFSSSLEKRLAEIATPTRRRRSYMVQDQLVAAVEESNSRKRQSLVKVAAREYQAQMEKAGSESMDDVTETMKECVVACQKQHRQSLLQAAEVVQLATICDESEVSDEWGAEHLTPVQLTMQLHLVQKAIEGARQKHRQSIVHVKP